MKNVLPVFFAGILMLSFASAWGEITYTGKWFSLKETGQVKVEKPAVVSGPEEKKADFSYRADILWDSINLVFLRDHKIDAKPDTVQVIDILDSDGDGKDEIFVLTRNDDLYTYTIDKREPDVQTITKPSLFGTTTYFISRYPMTFKNKSNLSDSLGSEKIRKMAGQEKSLKFTFLDMDGDRLLDLVILGNNAYIYQNRNGTFTRTARLNPLSNPYFTDLNQDGVKDIVSQATSHSVSIFLSGSDGSYQESVFPKVENIFQALGAPDFRVYVAKLERASRVPHLIFITKPLLGAGDMIIHRYDRKNNTFVAVWTNKSIPYNVMFKDIDGDNADEFIALDGPADVYTLDGLNATKMNFTPGTADALSYFIWEDFNRDNQLDFVLVNAGALFRSSYYYMRNRDSFTEQQLDRVRVELWDEVIPNGKYTNIVKHVKTNYIVRDIDGDGLKDLVTWNQTAMNVARNTGSGFVSYFDGEPGNIDEVFIDVNQDGKADYFNHKSIFINNGKTLERLRLSPDLALWKIAFFDVDGDGADELVGTGMGTLFSRLGIYVFDYKGGLNYEEVKSEFAALDHGGVQFMDVNGDGLIDIVDINDGKVLVNNGGK